MEEKGYRYTPPPPLGFAGGPITPGDLMSLAPVGEGDFAMAEMLRRAAEAADHTDDRGYDNLATAAARKGYWGATRKCFALPTPEVFTAEGSGDLAQDLVVVFQKVEKRTEVKQQISAYGACMKAAGFTAQDYTQLHQQVTGAFPDNSRGWKALSDSPEWAAAVDFEHRAAAADTGCRTGLRASAMTAAAPALQRFVVKNAEALAVTRASWSQQRKLLHR
jgi:hypothetical protein